MSNNIMKEIRNIREQYASSMNYDLDKMFIDLKQRQEQHAIQGWIIVSPPTNPSTKSNRLTRFSNYE